jgi:aldose 1-epimerase
MDIVEIASGRTRVSVAPAAGGRIVQIEVQDDAGWLQLLVAPQDLQLLVDEPLAWGCYPMAPWAGRVDGSRFTWRGVTYELPANDGRHSIHGRAMYLPWRVSTKAPNSCTMDIHLGPSEGWPLPCKVSQTIVAEDDAVVLRMEISTTGGDSFPAGCGWHPWFRRDVRSGAEPAVSVPAATHYERRPDLIPTGAVAQPAGDADLRGGPPLGSRRLDDFYGGVDQPMRITWGDVSLTMTSSGNTRHAVVFTESPRGFCVEPQTCVPDAFNLATRGFADTGLSVVEPGQPLVAETRWQWRIG